MAEADRLPSLYRAWPWLLVLGAWSVILYLPIAGLRSPLDHDYLLNAGHFPWWLAFLIFFVSWPLMIVAMMLPSVLPILAFNARRTGWRDQLAFLLAYMALWQCFAIVAFPGDTLLHQIARFWPWLARGYVSVGLLLLAGCFQFSKLKRLCLAYCRDCAVPRDATAWYEGWNYGKNCLASCWALMLLMFASGGKDLLVLAGISLIVLAEKSSVGARWIRLPVGMALLALAGLWLFTLLQP